MSRLRIATFVSIALMGSTIALADDPPKPKPPVQAEDPLKPVPPVAIPDDPPPYEGAMIDIPYIIEPPDIIVVEVLEALPGRPLTGEHLVRPDGTISLGFYGDVHVRGLTTRQAKVKILLHLRRYIADHVLGLVLSIGGVAEVEADPGMVPEPQPGRNPFDLRPNGRNPPGFLPEIVPPLDIDKKPDAEAKPPAKPESRASSSISPRERQSRDRVRSTRRARAVSQRSTDRHEAEQDPKPAVPTIPVPPAKPDTRPLVPDDHPLAEYFRKIPLYRPEHGGDFRFVEPADSLTVFVEVVSFNSKVYFVQGDVGVPGRLPFTGKETVLDALNYAGGFVPTAEPTDIHLYRPARGGKPAKDYRIDLDAIHKGVKTANLQMFPDDRLIIGRNPIVKKVVELDRANALINSQLNTMLQYGFTARTIGGINTPLPSGNAGDQIRVNGQNIPLNPANAPTLTPAQRDAMIKDWVEFLWSISSKEGGAMLDEKAFKEALMKKLTPAPELQK
jgi:protein involved in polysaccharide export with SLBB domain